MNPFTRRLSTFPISKVCSRDAEIIRQSLIAWETHQIFIVGKQKDFIIRLNGDGCGHDCANSPLFQKTI